MGWKEKIVAPERVRGLEFADLVYQTVKRRALEWDELQEVVNKKSTVVNEILLGGRFYSVPRVIREVFGFTPRTGYVKIQSREKPGKTDASVKYSKLVLGRTVVIGDTVASGSTLKTFLSLLPEDVEVFLFTIGTEEGVKEALRERKLHIQYIPFPVRLNPVNRTDMPIDPKKVPREFLESLLEETTEDILKIQCIIGDFSDSIFDVPSFLAEWYAILAQMYAFFDWKGDRESKKIVKGRWERLVEELLEWVEGDAFREMVASALNRRRRLKGIGEKFGPDDVSLDIEKVSSLLGEEDWVEFEALG